MQPGFILCLSTLHISINGIANSADCQLKAINRRIALTKIINNETHYTYHGYHDYYRGCHFCPGNKGRT
jgi:hypothetical protein